MATATLQRRRPPAGRGRGGSFPFWVSKQREDQADIVPPGSATAGVIRGGRPLGSRQSGGGGNGHDTSAGRDSRFQGSALGGFGRCRTAGGGYTFRGSWPRRSGTGR